MTIETIDTLRAEPNILGILGARIVNLIADHADRVTCLVDNSCLPPVDYDNFSFDGERYRVLYRARAFTFATPGEALEYIHDINSEAVGAAPIYIVLASDGETRLMERADETVITRDIEQTLTILRWVGKVKSVS